MKLVKTSSLLKDLKFMIIRSSNTPLRPLVTKRQTAGHKRLVVLYFEEPKIA